MKFQAKGFSLVELMVAMVISLILLIGALDLFQRTSQTDRTGTELARLQESGRVALEIFGADARRAGYQGCSSADSPITVDGLTFPADAISAVSGTSITFNYARLESTPVVMPATRRDCSNIQALYLHKVTYSNCGANLCLAEDASASSAIIDNASIQSILLGIDNSGTTTWVNGSSATTNDRSNAHVVRITFQISSANDPNMTARQFTGTFDLRNRLQ